MEFAIAVLVILCVTTGYFFGMLVERTRWNRLIDDGILPKPKTKDRN